jgi:hypothetical protein
MLDTSNLMINKGLDIETMGYRELQKELKHCKPLVTSGTEQLRKQLREHLSTAQC